MVAPDAIRIEDEVWQEAFTRREPARPSRERRLRAVERDHPDWLLETTGRTLAEAASWSVPSRGPRGGAPSPSTAVRSEPPVMSAIEAREPVDGVAEPQAADPEIAPLSAARTEVSGQADAAPVRRTIKIQGRGAERNLPFPDSSQRRPPRRAYERSGFRPDRLAMWAVMLGFVLVLIAILSAH